MFTAGLPLASIMDTLKTIGKHDLTPIAVLLAVVIVVIARLPKVEIEHDKAYRRRRILNWLPLGLTYAFLYMGRYNLTVSQLAFGDIMTSAGVPIMSNADFGWIFGIGTAVYGTSFLINGPFTDRFGGKKAILIGAGGSAVMNLLMGLCTWTLTSAGPSHVFVADNFFAIFSTLYGANMYFQSFGAVAIVKVNAPWFHVRERGVFGAIFGILISLGVFFAFDIGFKIIGSWGRQIDAWFGTGQMATVAADAAAVADPNGALKWVFLVPTILLAVFWLLDVLLVQNTPAEAGLADIDTADASSGDEGPPLGSIAVFKKMFANPIIMTIACVEFCSGFLRQAIMQWGRKFAKQTNETLGLMDTFVFDNWGTMLCCAGIMGGVFAGTISDHLFHSRRGPVAAVLYGLMFVSGIVLIFVFKTGMVGWLIILMSMAVIGVHGMLSGTASMDFGGKKNVGIAVGIIDGFVYAGTACMSILYAFILPSDKAVLVDGVKVVAAHDPSNWVYWPISMVPVALIGLVLASRVWNAKPKGKTASAS
ncbi:MAG: MFS transporter [Planctomycetota bacterium]|jgi:OPA family glycerol-3-phosphate transporter-like MFS transporter